MNKKRPLNAFTLAALALLGCGAALAQTQSPGDIEADIERLKQQLQQRERDLAAARAGAAAPAAAASAPAAPPAAPATAELGKVVVSATRTLEPIAALQDVPRSVSAVSGVELERLGATSITDVLRRINNVNFNFGNPRTGSLTMRGITTGSSDAIDPSVGLVLDGVSIAYSPIINGAVYVDIDTVEATHGPQGTLGYKNSSTGQIEIRSRPATFSPEASGSITFGTWNAVRATAVVGGPVVEGLLAWRGTLLREQSDGPYKNIYPDLQGRTSYPNTDNTYARVQLLLTPGHDITGKLQIENQPRGAQYINGLTVKLPQPRTYSDGVAISATTLNAAPENRLSRGWFTQYPNFSPATYFANPVDVDNNGAIITGSRAVTADVTWQPGRFSLRSITGFRDAWFSAANDEGTPFDITKSGGYITYYKQWSQEFRLGYAVPGLVDATTGVHLLATRNDSLTRTRYGSDAGAWFATGNGSVGNLQYGTLANNSNAALNANGDALLRDALNLLYSGTDTYVKNKGVAWYGSADWTLSDPLTLTTGLRLGDEHRHTTQYKLVLDPGYGSALNPVSVDNVSLGGFALDASNALTAANSAAQLQLADQVANRYYGVAVTATPGAAYASLSAAQKAQIAAARAVRAGQLTGLYQPVAAQPFIGKVDAANLSLRDKLNDDFTAYATLQYGEKAGISQINGATVNGGISVPVLPERSTALELGVRAALLDKTLLVNADIFRNELRNFQQTVSYLDPVLSALNGTPTYSSGVGNVKAVRVQGLEFDALYTGVRDLNLRLAGAYNDARYRSFLYAGLASELDPAVYGSFRDVSGKTLPNAPQFSYNASAEYRRPVFGSYVAHTSVNWNWTSKYDNDANLSAYGWVPAHGLLDLGLGIGRQDGLFDVNLIVKNSLNKLYNNPGWTSYTPAIPRWVGVQFSGKL